MPDKLDRLHILCYRWGTRYGVEYVNKLRNMVRRNLSVDHEFHCVTDSSEGLLEDIHAHPLPDIGVAGNWNKLQTFRHNFLDLQDQHIVCMDLDLVIVGSLDYLANNPDKDFMIAKNWAKGMRGNSSVYRLRVGSHTDIWDRFIADPESVISKFHGKTRLGGDQRWMNHSIEEYNYFPEKEIVSFKKNCGAKSRSIHIPFIGDLSLARYGTAKVPAGASVVAFTGNPLPPDVQDGPHENWRYAPFVNEHWK
jgi:hypothetical protein